MSRAKARLLQAMSHGVEMLTLKRKRGESIRVFPDEALDLNMTVGELFRDAEIIIEVRETHRGSVSVGIEAPAQLKIWRNDQRRERG
ncbi:MAG: carbon storage regulator [Gammaproteobacteria bacterium]|nr:carbon storage regulator [Gammaproteobacteria bacterium]